MWIRFLILAGLAFVLQATVMEAFSIVDARPDLLFILALFACYTVQDTGDALRVCWVLGLAKDIGVHGGLGFHALLFLGLGYLVVMVRSLFFKDDLVSQMAIVFIATWALHLVEALAVVIFTGKLYFGDIMLRVSVISLYTASLAPFMWRGLAKLRWST